MKLGSLFAGIGGFDLGLEWAGFIPTWQVEKDEFCQKVLAKHWPHIKRYGDIHDFIAECERGAVEPVDIIAGGPPCQPASLAGKRQGKEDDRWLWPQALRSVASIRPTWCLFENPLGFRTMGIDQVLSEMEGMGYACQSFVIPACSVDAPHCRDRIWMVAHSDSTRLEGVHDKVDRECMQLPEVIWKKWKAEPRVDRVALGIPNRVDRLKSLGNAVVPQIPYVIGKAIMEAERHEP